MVTGFEDTKHLCCNIHLRDNVMDEVTKGGLVDCTSSKAFDIALNNITSRWLGLHQNGDNLLPLFSKRKQRLSMKAQQRTSVECVCLVFCPRSTHKMQVNIGMDWLKQKMVSLQRRHWTSPFYRTNQSRGKETE